MLGSQQPGIKSAAHEGLWQSLGLCMPQSVALQLRQQPTSSSKKAGRHLKVGVMALHPTNSGVSDATLCSCLLRLDTVLRHTCVDPPRGESSPSPAALCPCVPSLCTCWSHSLMRAISVWKATNHPMTSHRAGSCEATTTNSQGRWVSSQIEEHHQPTLPASATAAAMLAA
jgi:hypothetical protein